MPSKRKRFNYTLGIAENQKKKKYKNNILIQNKQYFGNV
jgi:hypothetical protein